MPDNSAAANLRLTNLLAKMMRIFSGYASPAAGAGDEYIAPPVREVEEVAEYLRAAGMEPSANRLLTTVSKIANDVAEWAFHAQPKWCTESQFCELRAECGIPPEPAEMSRDEIQLQIRMRATEVVAFLEELAAAPELRAAKAPLACAPESAIRAALVAILELHGDPLRVREHYGDVAALVDAHRAESPRGGGVCELELLGTENSTSAGGRLGNALRERGYWCGPLTARDVLRALADEGRVTRVTGLEAEYVCNGRIVSDEPAWKIVSQCKAAARGSVLGPLTVTEQQVFDLIKGQPAGAGISGCELVAKLRRGGRLIEQSTLTRHIIPKLKQCGVKNRRGAGYYFDPPT